MKYKFSAGGRERTIFHANNSQTFYHTSFKSLMYFGTAEMKLKVTFKAQKRNITGPLSLRWLFRSLNLTRLQTA